MSAHTPGRPKAYEGLTKRLRVMDARELPREVQFKTNVTLHSDGNHMVAGFVMGAGFTREVAQEIARRVNAHEDLLAACELVLALNDHPESRTPGFWKEQPAPQGRPLLDPMAAAQLRAAIAKARGE